MPNENHHQHNNNNNNTNQMYQQQQQQQDHHPFSANADICGQPPQTHFGGLPNNIHLDLDSINTSSMKTLPSSNQTKSSSHLAQNHHYLYHTNHRTKPSPNPKSNRIPASQSTIILPNREHSFNPFADENDRSSNHFQLSKTSSVSVENPTQSKTNGRPVESSPFARTFGFNRTNLMWSASNSNGGLKVEAQPSGTLATHLHTSPNVSRFQIRTSSSSTNRSPTNGDSTRLQAFRQLLPVDTHSTASRTGAKSGSPYRSSANRTTDQMQFKCFDLSDEAGWLNFE